MPTTRMEMNHRILVPKEICEATGAKLGTRFIWEMQKDGSIRVIAKCKRPPWAEPLEKPKGETSGVEDVEADAVMPAIESLNESQTGDESPTDRPPPVAAPSMASRC